MPLQASSQKPLSIGIDFGTTHTCVAILDAQGKTHALELNPSGQGNPKLVKTLLYFPNKKEAYFGQEAILQYFEQGMEGRFFQSIKKLLPNSEFTGTSLFGTHAGVEELIARFLDDLKKKIEDKIGPMEGIPLFIGRPARYSEDMGKEGLAVVRFKRALSMVGWEHARLIEEPVAAAVSSGATEGLTLVADLGGGTSDFTLYSDAHTYAVHGISVAGDTLDSAFFEEKLNEPFGSKIQYQRPFSSNVLTLPKNLIHLLPKWHHHGFLREKATWNFILSLRKELVDPQQKPLLENLITLVEDNLGYQLHLEVERVKIALSEKKAEDFSFQVHPIDLCFLVNYNDYDEMIEGSVEKIIQAALETCRIGKKDPNEVKNLRLTGGTSQVPLIRESLKNTFPQAQFFDQETYTAVAEGLAKTKIN